VEAYAGGTIVLEDVEHRLSLPSREQSDYQGQKRGQEHSFFTVPIMATAAVVKERKAEEAPKQKSCHD
jgi:hypothetical protein